MNGELMPYATGQVDTPWRDRAVAKAAKQVYDETRLDGYRISATAALASHAMDEVKQLDDHRRKLAGEDAVLNIALIDIENAALKGVTDIVRRSSTNRWNL